MQIYDLLKQDHQEVKEMLTELISLQDNDEYRFVLIEEIAKALIPHSRSEESVFYNTIRAVDADKSLVAHGYKEHMEAEALLRTLQVKDKIHLDWKSTAKKLSEALDHHIAEEESKIFGEAKKIFSDDEAEKMGEAFVALKKEVQKEGFMGTTFDMVMNLLPPRLATSLKNFGDKSV